MQYRSLLKSRSGVNIDASILDEARVNRPGAVKVEYTNAPKFGSYRPPPEKLMVDVRDKYVWKKDAKKPDDEELESKVRSLSAVSPAQSYPKQPTSLKTLAEQMKVNVFDKDKSSSGQSVEVVGSDQGPKTAEEKVRPLYWCKR